MPSRRLFATLVIFIAAPARRGGAIRRTRRSFAERGAALREQNAHQRRRQGRPDRKAVQIQPRPAVRKDLRPMSWPVGLLVSVFWRKRLR